MKLPIVQVDAFTAVPFAGNPAAVCISDAPIADERMALVARETGLPATAFLHDAGDGAYQLRWFTASTELELCGHGTLASAHVLYESGRVPVGAPVRFSTRAGTLTATRQDGWIELDFPSTPDREADATADVENLVAALGVARTDVVYVGRGRLDYLVEVTNETVVRDLTPDTTRLRGVPTRGIIVTSQSASTDRDFVSRFFAPATGIDEDAVTGSAHCCLTPYWSRRLGRQTFVAHQLSKRGGVLRVTLDGDRVRIAGQAVTVIQGSLKV